MEAVTDFIFLEFKITVNGDCSYEMKRHLFLGKKAITNLEDSVWKSRANKVLYSQSEVKSLIRVRLFATPWPAAFPTMGFFSPRLLRPWDFQARILEWVTISFSRRSSQPRDWTGSPALWADSLPSEPPGKPRWFRELSSCDFTHKETQVETGSIEIKELESKLLIPVLIFSSQSNTLDILLIHFKPF